MKLPVSVPPMMMVTISVITNTIMATLAHRPANERGVVSADGRLVIELVEARSKWLQRSHYLFAFLIFGQNIELQHQINESGDQSDRFPANYRSFASRDAILLMVSSQWDTFVLILLTGHRGPCLKKLVSLMWAGHGVERTASGLTGRRRRAARSLG